MLPPELVIWLALIPDVQRHNKIELRQDLKEATLGERGKLVPGGRSGDEDVNGSRAHLDGAEIKMPSILGGARESNGASTGEVQDSRKETRDVIMTSRTQDLPKTNGTHTPTEPAYTNGVPPTPPELNSVANATEMLIDQLPPEVAHWTMGYISMSGLLERLVQETFNGVVDVINDMAEVTIPQSLTNGSGNYVNNRVGGPQAGDTSQANIQKKARMFDFANSRRAQFIKVLVLSRWARQAESLSRAIDLRIWLSQKQEDYNSAVYWMGELKRKLAAVKEPKPDIDTALEVLSLGRASWLPDPGYIPLKQLSPRQLLDGLRRINTLLSIRLNVHEAIPPILRNFSISSGRATFRVPDEFEFDVSLADEDPCKQLYFIDFRPTFSPAPAALPPGPLREDFEARANDILSREGLRGLFDFMHNLILTHKLIILRNQSFEMARGYWSQHLKIEPVRRSVVVQYWCDRPGGKNWIEVGIRRARTGSIAYADGVERIPQLALRWFRGGKEIIDAEIDLGPGDLSMERILKQILAQHSNHTFAELAARLSHGRHYSSGLLRLKRRESAANPAEVSLLVQLTTSKAIKVIIEPVSGRFAISPPSNLNSRAEYELNRLATPAKEGSNHISYLRAIALQEVIDSGVRRVGWEVVRSLHPGQETMQRLFSKSTQRTRFYRRTTWDKGWVLAFTTGPDGDCWWVVEVSDRKPTHETATAPATGLLLRAAYRIASETSERLITVPSQTSLALVERDAAGIISQFVDTRYLAASRTPHKIQLASSVSSLQRSMSVYIRLLVRQAPPTLHSANPLSLPWANEVVKLDYRGLNASHSAAVHIVSARLNRPFSNLKDLVASVPGAAFHRATGAFAIRLQTKVGETSIHKLTQSLSAVERLRNFAAVIKAHGLKTDRTSLDGVEFTYQQLPTALKATVHFPVNAAIHMTLSAPNPHLRILDHLTRRLRAQGLVAVLALLRMSLPLLTTFARLESSANPDQIIILARSEQWFQVRYSYPIPKGGFDVQLRQHRDESQWFIPDSSIKTGGSVSDENKWQQHLRRVTRGKGEGWRGMNGGIVGTMKGMQDAVEKLHALFASANSNLSEASRRGKRKVEEEIVEID